MYMLHLQQKGSLMGNYYNIFKKSKLFSGIEENELDLMLNCLNATIKEYKKDDFIFHVGEKITDVGFVLSGTIHIINEDYWGNRVIISQLKEGNLFGESYSCSNSLTTTISAVATEDTKIMFLDVKRIITTCSSACIFHIRLIKNLITVLSEKNILLTSKIDHTSKRTTREKLLSYLSEQSKNVNSSSFDIPFNRQQLADYLCVDRSAMSSELSKMKKEGILDYNKSHIQLF